MTSDSPSVTAPVAIDQLAINTIRKFSVDTVKRAPSGDARALMGLAPLGYRLFTRHLRHDPADPTWPDRDRFVLSSGSASMLYALLHLCGYDLDVEDLEAFRQLDSRTPGFPQFGETPGVEATTGPPGQGFANAVGMALAERMLAARYNRDGHHVVDHRTWVFASVPDLMEGVASEAASLAGHLGLDRLIVCYGHGGSDSGADMAFSEDVEARFRAYGWLTSSLSDGDDIELIDRVCTEALHARGQPTLVRVHTGPTTDREEASGWHYEEPFTVPDAVEEVFDQRARGASLHEEWNERFSRYREAHQQPAAQFERVMAGQLPDGWDDGLPTFADTEPEATRVSSGAVIDALARVLPELVGGSAGLMAANRTTIEDGGDVGLGRFDGRNLQFGAREHGMAAVLSGMTLHGGLRVFGASFLTLADHCRPAIRLACLMRLPVIYVMTHDSIGVGQDGPVYQPVEQIASLRAIPNLHVLRPADARETVGAWREAVARTDGPTVLLLTRQAVPQVEGTDPARVRDGAYVLDDDEGEPDVVLLATGSEVHVAVEARQVLASDDIVARVVTIPSWEHFDNADDEYQDEVLPPDIPVLSIEAGTTFGWERWADDYVGVDEFGASAPGDELLERYGFTGPAVADAAMTLLDDSPDDLDHDDDSEDAP